MIWWVWRNITMIIVANIPVVPSVCVETASPPPVPVSPSCCSVVLFFIGAIGKNTFCTFSSWNNSFMYTIASQRDFSRFLRRRDLQSCCSLWFGNSHRAGDSGLCGVGCSSGLQCMADILWCCRYTTAALTLCSCWWWLFNSHWQYSCTWRLLTGVKGGQLRSKFTAF